MAFPHDGKKMQKGQTLNPNGRPKGSRNRSTIARQWLEALEKVKNPLTQQVEELSQEDIMTLALINKARKGDVNAYKALMDSGYGAPIQQTDITTDGQAFSFLTTEQARQKAKELDNDY